MLRKDKEKKLISERIKEVTTYNDAQLYFQFFLSRFDRYPRKKFAFTTSTNSFSSMQI